MSTNVINLIISIDDKCLLEQAADLNNVSLNDYIISKVIEQAKRDIKESSNIHLSEKGFEKLIEMMDNPPEPTPALKRILN